MNADLLRDEIEPLLNCEPIRELLGNSQDFLCVTAMYGQRFHIFFFWRLTNSDRSHVVFSML